MTKPTGTTGDDLVLALEDFAETRRKFRRSLLVLNVCAAVLACCAIVLTVVTIWRLFA